MQDPPLFAAMLQKPVAQYAEQEHLTCPRCKSTDTKFCYYNNYNLSQPRHFCKSCRRYWTKGGTLRNVPVGGSSQKTSKRAAGKRPSSASNPAGGAVDPKPETGGGLGLSSELLPVGSFTSMLIADGQLELGSFMEMIEPGRGNGSACGAVESGGGEGWLDLASGLQQ